MDTKLVGRWGEEQAAKYLKGKGFKILEQGYRTRFGEVDIIAADRHFLVFAEVKTRKSDSFAKAMEYVDSRKQKKLVACAQLWLAENVTRLQPRFDVIEVYYGETLSDPKINHIENAFGA